MRKILLIIQREYLTRVKKKSFLIMTIIGPLLMAALMIGSIWMSIGIEESQKVLVVDESRMFAQLKNSDRVHFYYTTMKLSEAKEKFHESEYTSLIYIHPKIFEGNAAELFYKKQPGLLAYKYIESTLEERLEQYKLMRLKRMVKSELLDDFYRDIKTSLTIKPINYSEPGKEKKESKEAGYIGFVFAVLIYLFIFMYGVQVMRGVIEEKTSRIIEVIISSVKPFELMMGKIMGIALVGLTQFVLWIILTTGIITIAKQFFFKEKYNIEEVAKGQMSIQMMRELQSEKPQLNQEEISSVIDRINFPYMIGMFLFYFMGGYLLYGALFAAIGSAVDSESDTQQFMLPVTIPLIFAFMVAQSAMQNPQGPVAVWASIIPLTSPIVMMIRIATVPFNELAPQLLLSMVLLVVAFVLATLMAGKIYRTGILMYGKKVNYKELWKWIFFKN